MRIAYNPKTAAALSQAPANNDITFDLSGLSIYVKGIRFKGTDTTYSVFKKHNENGGGYDGLVPVPDYNNGLFNRFLREDGTWQYIADSTDINVYQSEDDTSDFRPVILGLTHSADITELVNPVTGQVYVTAKIYACPSTGVLYATKLFSNGKEVLTEHLSLEDYVTLHTPQTITGRKTFYTLININNGDKNDDGSLYVRPIIYMDASKFMIYSDTKSHTVVRGSAIRLQTSNGVDTVNILPDTVKTIAKIVSDSTILGTLFISTIEDSAPLIVNSAALVAKLNSDLLDGYHAAGLFEKLENSGNELSLTIGGTKKNLIVNYATNSGKLGHSIKFKDIAYLDVIFDGSTDVDLTAGIFHSSNADYLLSHDTRSVNNTPATFGSGARFEFKFNSTDGLSDGNTYHGILHFRPYGSNQDFSGGQTHLLGFTDNGNLYIRTSTNSSTWGNWYKILHSGNLSGFYWANVNISNNPNTLTNPSFASITLNHPTSANSSRGVLKYYNGSHGWGDYLISDSNGPHISLQPASGGNVYLDSTTIVSGNATIGIKSKYYLRSARGLIHHEFVCDDSDYGGVKITHNSTEGSGGPGSYTASLFVLDNRIAHHNGAYQPTVYIQRAGATRQMDPFGIDVGSRVFTVGNDGRVTIGARMVSSISSEQSVIRETIIPYYHTGGPWYIKSKDDNSSAFLTIDYNTTECLRIKHDGEIKIAKSLWVNNSHFFKLSGTTFTCQGGTTFTLPYSGLNTGTALLWTTASDGTRDTGIFYNSSDFAFIANSNDHGAVFAVYDTDVTQDFEAGAREISVPGGGGALWARGGFSKEGSSNNYVLLGGGGHKAISDFAASGHTHPYLPLSGGTISNNTRSLLLIKNTNATGNSTIWFGGNFNNFTSGAVTEYNGNDGGMYITNFKSYTTNNQNIASLRITSNGNIQCGDANYMYKVYDVLHSGNYNSYAPSLTGTGASGTWSINITGSAAKLQTARTIWGQSFDGTGNVDGTLSINGTAGSWTEGIRIHPPSTGWTTLIFCGTDNTSSSGTSANSWSMHGYSGNFYINRASSSSTTPYILCNVNGNWGIGTNLPSQKLHVVGNILATGTITATHFYESSDILLKKNISSILGTDNIPILRKFNWKKDGKVGYGFIALELEELGYNELVSWGEDGLKTVHYTAALSLVVAKLQNKIKELEKEIEMLKV